MWPVIWPTIWNMADRLLFNSVIDPEMKRVIEVIKERDGISESEQARRALAAWIELKGIRPQR
jgi:hypothetical protein